MVLGYLLVMDALAADLKKILKGEVDDTAETRALYSHDASLFELTPEIVAYPKDTEDVKHLVTYVAQNKPKNKKLSLTPRSGGTCMSGGSINNSVIVDINRHFNKITKVGPLSANVQPGVFYRDFDPVCVKHGNLLPSYPASRELCTLGGMVANHSGGEKSLEFGKTDRYVSKLEVVLSDGNAYTLKPLNKRELTAKMSQQNFEGKIYRQIFQLIEDNYDEIKSARPKVSKNSTGYNLWSVWDRQSGVFDLTQLFVGSQGTLGIITDIHFKLVKRPKHSGLLVCFMKDIGNLGEIINVVLTHKPASFESFDDNTLTLALKFFPYFYKTLGPKAFIKLGLSLIPDGLILARGIPKLVLMIEFTGHTAEEVADKIHQMRKTLEPYKMLMEEDETEAKSQKFWTLRRESFNLLRKKVKDKHTAPFIDDLVVAPEHLPKFLPQLRKIIKKYKLLATIAGHMGDGNFHIIPLMNIEDEKERDKLKPAMYEVNELVLSYGGSLSGEHNDGMIRGPWLKEMYGVSMLAHFKAVKSIFDENNIFNPHKKTDATWEFSMKHIRKHF